MPVAEGIAALLEPPVAEQLNPSGCAEIKLAPRRKPSSAGAGRGRIDYDGLLAVRAEEGGTTLYWFGTLLPHGESRLHQLVYRLSMVDFHTMMLVYTFLLLSSVWLALARGRWAGRAAAVLVTAFSLLWFGVNQQWEGRILYSVSSSHGVTQSDLAVPLLIVSAAVVRSLRFVLARATDGPESTDR
jgi:hypothetical protein